MHRPPARTTVLAMRMSLASTIVNVRGSYTVKIVILVSVYVAISIAYIRGIKLLELFVYLILYRVMMRNEVSPQKLLPKLRNYAGSLEF